jgi:predicted Zn-dependent peptidase
MTRPATLYGAGLLALVLTAAPASAGTPAVTRHVLSNGMTVLVREHPVAAVVAVSLQVRAGSRFETPETAGITNLLLRSMLRGTGKRSALQLVEAAEEIGGSVEASGEVEAAEVRGEALARDWEALLDLVGEVVLDPVLAPEEVEKERRLVLSQIQTRGDTPFPLSFDTVIRDLYGGHPYGWHSLGFKGSVERVTREALLARYREIFQPDRLVLAVSGQVARERVVKTAERLFGRLKRSGAALAPAADGPAPPGGRRVVERPAQQAQILIGYLGPGLGDPAYPAIRVLGAVLGGGMAGRLFVELRDKRGLAYSVGVLTPYRTGPAFFVTYLGTAQQNAAAAETAVLAELARIRTAPPTAEELARAKAYVLGNLALDRRTNTRRAWYLAFFEVIGAGWDFPERYAHAVEAVTATDVATAAQRYLTQPTIVLLQPRPR